jgi:N-acetyl-gamma-glutamyl-phosphate reductase
MIKVGIIGASGYSGGELLRILASHPDAKVAHATSRSNAGKKISTVHPNLRGVLDIKFRDPSPQNVANDCDLVFTATPHKTSMKIVPILLENGSKVVDLSGDFRFRDTSTYERY